MTDPLDLENDLLEWENMILNAKLTGRLELANTNRDSLIRVHQEISRLRSQQGAGKGQREVLARYLLEKENTNDVAPVPFQYDNQRHLFYGEADNILKVLGLAPSTKESEK